MWGTVVSSDRMIPVRMEKGGMTVAFEVTVLFVVVFGLLLTVLYIAAVASEVEAVRIILMEILDKLRKEDEDG